MLWFSVISRLLCPKFGLMIMGHGQKKKNSAAGGRGQGEKEGLMGTGAPKNNGAVVSRTERVNKINKIFFLSLKSSLKGC